MKEQRGEGGKKGRNMECGNYREKRKLKGRQQERKEKRNEGVKGKEWVMKRIWKEKNFIKVK